MFESSERRVDLFIVLFSMLIIILIPLLGAVSNKKIKPDENTKYFTRDKESTQKDIKDIKDKEVYKGILKKNKKKHKNKKKVQFSDSKKIFYYHSYPSPYDS